MSLVCTNKYFVKVVKKNFNMRIKNKELRTFESL
jgi:hypothetical protein